MEKKKSPFVFCYKSFSGCGAAFSKKPHVQGSPHQKIPVAPLKLCKIWYIINFDYNSALLEEKRGTL